VVPVTLRSMTNNGTNESSADAVNAAMSSTQGMSLGNLENSLITGYHPKRTRYLRALTLRESRHHKKLQGDSVTFCAPLSRRT